MELCSWMSVGSTVRPLGLTKSFAAPNSSFNIKSTTQSLQQLDAPQQWQAQALLAWRRFRDPSHCRKSSRRIKLKTVCRVESQVMREAGLTWQTNFADIQIRCRGIYGPWRL